MSLRGKVPKKIEKFALNFGSLPNKFKKTVHVCGIPPNLSILIKWVFRPIFIVPGVLRIDQDECVNGAHTCDRNALCENKPGSYNCTCVYGYRGNGSVCTDIDECTNNTSGRRNTNSAVCDRNADCTNTPGNYTCQCQNGYTGDGFMCTGRLHHCRFFSSLG